MGPRFLWWVFGLSSGLLIVAYVVYPGLVYILGRLLGRPPRRNHAWRPTVSVIIVARNEESVIGDRVANILQSDYPREKMQIVLADDASQDETATAAWGAGGDHISLVCLDEHRGKAAGINAACSRASGEILVFTDARQAFEGSTIPTLVADLADPAVGAASGALSIRAKVSLGLYWRIEKTIRYWEGRLCSTVGATGAVYAIRRDDFTPIAEDTILDDVVIPLNTAAKRGRTVFDPAAPAWDEAPTPAREWRRKVRTLAGNFQLLFEPGRMGHPFQTKTAVQFLFHKVTRLFVPLALAGLMLSTLFLVELWPLFVAQLAFYTLALFGAVAAWRGLRIGPFGIPFAFVLLNGAVVAAFVSYVSGRTSSHWKR